jgi:Fe2+ or Zn2+ uptake regulation protein
MSAALDALALAGLRKTPQRLAIVRAFVDDPGHPTAQTIFDRLQASMPTMSFATVYNTLAALEAAGACRSLQLSSEGGHLVTRFDPNVEPHDHAVCDVCGAVRDIPHTGSEPTPRSVRTEAHDRAPAERFSVRAIERVYRGACERCVAA